MDDRRIQVLQGTPIFGAIQARPLEVILRGTVNVQVPAGELFFREGEPANAMFVLYTDGVTEARSPAGELFGVERLRSAFREASNGTADGAVRGVVAAVERFADGAPQEDDVTMLALRWRG
jgi:hypothetical protein